MREGMIVGNDARCCRSGGKRNFKKHTLGRRFSDSMEKTKRKNTRLSFAYAFLHSTAFTQHVAIIIIVSFTLGFVVVFNIVAAGPLLGRIAAAAATTATAVSRR
jgi:hypothetical protein